jgi:exopolysaccharide production protein ExoQ
MIIPRQALRALYDIYIVFVLTLSAGAFVSNFIGKQEANPEGSPVLKLAWGLIYIVTILRLMSRRREAVHIIRCNKPLVYIILLALASTIWSIDPPRTLTTAATLALTSLVALDISLSYGIQRQLEAICLVLFAVMALSVIVEVFFPGFVPGGADQGDAWHGVFVAKNNFGRATCLYVTAFITLYRNPWIRGVIVASGVGLALLSQSVSAVIYIGLMVLIVASWSIFKWKNTPRAIAIIVVIVSASIAVGVTSKNLTLLTLMVGKDPHMSKRTDLWELSLAAVRNKPALGYGFVAFWNANSQPAARIREELSWEVPHAHNGYIEVALGLGMAGLILCAIVYAEISKRAYMCFMGGTESYRRWPLSFLATTILYQFTESTILNGNNINFLLFCCLAFSLSNREQKRHITRESSSSALAA